MFIGVPKEIKNHEYRVGLTPEGAGELVGDGHRVAIETGAGASIGFADEDYISSGAEIAPDADTIFSSAEMIIKVKEPQPDECRKLRPGQILFTYLHLAPDPVQTELLIASGASCIAYETVTSPTGGLPLLAPMSEVAGRLSIQAGCHSLEKAQGGSGVLLGGVPGVEPGRVLILGGGVVGLNAARMAMGLGADVTILDRSIDRLKEIDTLFGPRLKTLFSTRDAIERNLATSDLIIGAVLIPGAAAPKLISREQLHLIRAGSVLVDVAIDQGGCFESSHATTHADPCYIVDGVVHYCVANMPGGVARTSTQALTNATLPYARKIAKLGLAEALLADRHFRDGLNIHSGRVTHASVAEALGYEHHDAVSVLTARAAA